MIGAKNFIGSLINQWLQKWSNCKIWDSIKLQKETFLEMIFKSGQWFHFWMILTLWPKSFPIESSWWREQMQLQTKHLYVCHGILVWQAKPFGPTPDCKPLGPTVRCLLLPPSKYENSRVKTCRQKGACMEFHNRRFWRARHLLSTLGIYTHRTAAQNHRSQVM